MATKKTTKKRAPKKQTVETMDLHQPYDLNIDSREKAETLIAHLKALRMNTGWIILKQIMEGNIAIIERQIVLKQGIDGSELTNEQVDELRKSRNIMEEMIEKPDDLIKQFEAQSGQGIPKYDPYQASMAEGGKAIQENEYASSLT